MANIVYCTKPVRISGTDADSGDVWELSLAQGWNKMYQVVVSTTPEVMRFTDVEPVGGTWRMHE